MKIKWRTGKTPIVFRLVLVLLLLVGVVLLSVKIKAAEMFNSLDEQSVASITATEKSDISLQDFPSKSVIQKQYPVKIQIDQVTSYSDRYFVKGTVTQSDISKGVLKSVEVSQMYLFDSLGKQIQIESINYAYSPSPNGIQFSFYTANKGVPGNWVLVIPSIEFSFQDTGAVFSVDFGANPRVGDEIKVSQEFVISGHKIRVDSLKLLTWNDWVRVQFSIEGDEEIRNLSIAEVNSELRDSYSFSARNLDKFLINLDYYSGDYKPGKQNFKIKSLSFLQTGNWQIKWRPDEIAHPGTIETSELNDACFTGSQLENLLSQTPIPFPKNFSGHLFAKEYSSSGAKASILLLPDLVVQKEFDLDYSDSALLSPDGKYLVYYKSGDQKIVIQNWKSGIELSMPMETYIYPDGIVFSDDSSTVSFHNLESIKTIEVQSLKSVSEIPQMLSPIRWLEEGRTLLAMQYVPKSEGGYLFTVDAKTGEKKEFWESEKIIGYVTVSPNKELIVYVDSIIDTSSQGLFISEINGRNRRLLIYQPYPYNIGSISWSPDGKWVLISLLGSDRVNKSLLIDPMTCEAHLLNAGDFEISQWVN